MKKFLKLTSEYHEQVLAGTAITVIGIFLIASRQYFFWPPEWSSTLNDLRIDVIVLIAGIGMLVSAYTDNRIRWLKTISFILAGAIILALGVAQLLHVIFAGQFRMAYAIIGDLVIFALIIHAAYESQAVRGLHDLSNLIQMLALFIGAVSTALATTHKNNRSDYASIIEELKSERDSYKRRCEDLQKKLDRAREELLKVKSRKLEEGSKNERK